MIQWDLPNAKFFQHGTDRGVLYPSGAVDPVAWNGITGVDESGNGATAMYYIDGRAFLADATATDFAGKLTAFFFPDEFATCLGMPQVTDGLVLDNQKPRRFGLSYRSLVGSGTTGDMFGYQIHLLYNCFAVMATVSRKTINATPTPMEFSFDITATPVKLPGFRPTAHYIIDTRRLDVETVAELEAILYGATETARLPDPTELFELLSFGTGIEVTSYLASKTINFKGAASNVFMTSADTFQINNVNAVDNGDGTYTISDGGETTVTEV